MQILVGLVIRAQILRIHGSLVETCHFTHRHDASTHPEPDKSWYLQNRVNRPVSEAPASELVSLR